MLIAHRGLASNIDSHELYMENTRFAIRRAQYLGYQGVEVDVQLTADNIAVLWHDRYVYTKDGAFEISKLKYHHLVKIIKHNTLYMENGKVWEPVKKRIEKLKDVLDLFPNMVFNLEIKVYDDCLAYKRHVVIRVMDFVLKRKNVIVSSFDLDVCRLVRHEYMYKKVMLLIDAKKDMNKIKLTVLRHNLYGMIFDSRNPGAKTLVPELAQTYVMCRIKRKKDNNIEKKQVFAFIQDLRVPPRATGKR